MKLEILNKADTLKKIASIAKSTGTTNENIQAAVIGGLAHAAEHGDVTLLTKLCNAVSTGNATQLRKYIKGFAPVSWVKGKGFVKAKKGGAYRVADAVAVDWNTYEAPGAEAAPFNGARKLAAIFAKLDALYLEAVENGDEETAEAIAKLALAK